MSRSVNLQYSTICIIIYTGKHQMAIIVRVKDSKVAAVLSVGSRHGPLTSSMMIASREVGAVNDEIMASSVNMAACPYTHR